MTRAAILLALALAASAEPIQARTEWVALSADSRALWVEGDSDPGTVSLDLKVADDTVTLAFRETIASDGRFRSLLRPDRLPFAAYVLEIRRDHEVLRIPLLHGSEAERAAYAELEIAYFGRIFEDIRSLTRELHRVHDDHRRAPDRAAWDRWSAGWERRRAELESGLVEFRARRQILARAREHYRLLSSLCFAKTLHALYASGLGFREPEGQEAGEWSTALEEQMAGFAEERTPIGPVEILRWVEALRSEDCAAREEATAGLARAGEAAREALERAAESEDREAAGRARELLERIRK